MSNPLIAPAAFRRSKDALAELRDRDGADQGRNVPLRAKKRGQVELVSLVRDEQGSIENQSHADFNGG